MMKFSEFVQIKEGLWLNDKKAIVGLSRLPPAAQLLPKKRQSAPDVLKPIKSVPKIHNL
jgi:hypothetical protein